MYNGKRILAVVPARGGSKGIPLKNLRHIAGRSLVGWVGVVVKEVSTIDRVIVSTDHEEIAAEAERYGVEAPFRRPASLSGDRIGDREVLEHALREIENNDGVIYDIVVMLQPTSPLRRAEHIRAAIERLVDGGYEAVWSVTETDLKSHPLKQLVIDENGRLRYYDQRGSEIIARQQLTPVFHRNGIVYAVTRNCLLTARNLLPENSAALVVDDPVVNIDSEDDLASAVNYLERNEAEGSNTNDATG